MVRDRLDFPSVGNSRGSVFSLEPSLLSLPLLPFWTLVFCVSFWWFLILSLVLLFFFADQDLAECLFSTLPGGWLTHHQVSSASKIFTVLQELRGHSSLEDRVDQALLILGSHPT